MSQTNTNIENGNTNQCQDIRKGGHSQGVWLMLQQWQWQMGNNSFSNYSFEGKLKDSCLFNLIITKSGHQSTQLKKILDVLPDLCQDKYYKYSNDILSTNTKPTQAYFLLAYPVRTQ